MVYGDYHEEWKEDTIDKWSYAQLMKSKGGMMNYSSSTKSTSSTTSTMSTTSKNPYKKNPFESNTARKSAEKRSSTSPNENSKPAKKPTADGAPASDDSKIRHLLDMGFPIEVSKYAPSTTNII
jgi:hypothetical protein